MDDSKVEFIITLLLGEFDIHKFMQGKSKVGIIYFFAFCLFGICWLCDVVVSALKMTNTYISSYSKSIMNGDRMNKNNTRRKDT